MKCEKYVLRKKPRLGYKAPQAKDDQPSATKANEHQKGKTVHLSTGHKERFERMETHIPHGFRQLVEKILRAVLNARPLHVLMFVSEYLEAEMSRRTFFDMCYGCQLRKSLRDPLYPSESCKCLGIMPPPVEKVDEKSADDDGPGGIDAFMKGPIKERHLCAPALDRYKQLSGIGSFHTLANASGDVAGGGRKSAAHMTPEERAAGAGYRLPNCNCAFCAMQARSPGRSSVLVPKQSGVRQQERGRCQQGGRGGVSVLYDVFTDAPVAQPPELTGAAFTVHEDGEFIPRVPSFRNERLFAEQDKDSFGLTARGQEHTFDEQSRPSYMLDEKQFMQHFVDTDAFIDELIERGLVSGDPAEQDTSVSYGMLSYYALSAGSGSCDEMGGGVGGGYDGQTAADGNPVPSTQLGEPYTVFGDTLFYAEPTSKIKVFDGDTMKPGEPFGSTFQSHAPFDDAFQPEYPLGEKGFMETNDAAYLRSILPTD